MQSVCWQKGILKETCDKVSKTQFIVDVEVTAPDVQELLGIQTRLEAADMKHEEQYVDAGFVK